MNLLKHAETNLQNDKALSIWNHRPIPMKVPSTDDVSSAMARSYDPIYRKDYMKKYNKRRWAKTQRSRGAR